VEPKSDKPKPIRVFRAGAIAASVWQRQTGTGLAYFDFSISRSWKSSTSGKEGYSANFFPQNADALTDVVRQASDWIVEQTAGTIAPPNASAADVSRAA
jgi:hypothetical protein